MIRRDTNDEPFGEVKPEVKTEKKTVLRKIADRAREWRDTDVEVDGYPVSPATAKLLREREGSEYIGTSFQRLAREVRPGLKDTWVPYRADLHAHCETKIIAQEFSIVPDGLNGYSEVYLSPNGAEPVVIGHRIATSILEKMKDNSALTETGLRLLAAQSVEEAKVEASETK